MKELFSEEDHVNIKRVIANVAYQQAYALTLSTMFIYRILGEALEKIVDTYDHMNQLEPEKDIS